MTALARLPITPAQVAALTEPTPTSYPHDCHDFVIPCPLDGGHSITGMISRPALRIVAVAPDHGINPGDRISIEVECETCEGGRLRWALVGTPFRCPDCQGRRSRRVATATASKVMPIVGWRPAFRYRADLGFQVVVNANTGLAVMWGNPLRGIQTDISDQAAYAPDTFTPGNHAVVLDDIEVGR